MSDALIQFLNVRKSFGSQTVLDGVNLSISRGATTTVIGRSGTGKSVLIKHIAGLLRPDSGKILYAGHDLAQLKSGDWKAIKSKLSYMFQNMALFDSMTNYDNIALPLREKTRMSEVRIAKEVNHLLEALELQNCSEKYPSQISGGMRKRVALARALITKPELVMFDEPDTGLDPIRKTAVYDMIQTFQNRLGFTAIVVSHEIPDIFRISNRVAMLDQGRIVYEGASDEIEHCDVPLVQDFLAGRSSSEMNEASN
jgi:phospholipid/cholesterol/gamma-HCH transport system ATP-binding protein